LPLRTKNDIKVQDVNNARILNLMSQKHVTVMENASIRKKTKGYFAGCLTSVQYPGELAKKNYDSLLKLNPETQKHMAKQKMFD
jgi:hypothetical protein